jgi:hypothetical protein
MKEAGFIDTRVTGQLFEWKLGTPVLFEWSMTKSRPMLTLDIWNMRDGVWYMRHNIWYLRDNGSNSSNSRPRARRLLFEMIPIENRRARVSDWSPRFQKTRSQRKSWAVSMRWMMTLNFFNMAHWARNLLRGHHFPKVSRVEQSREKSGTNTCEYKWKKECSTQEVMEQRLNKTNSEI